jgi:hypothetical protein
MDELAVLVLELELWDTLYLVGQFKFSYDYLFAIEPSFKFWFPRDQFDFQKNPLLP